MYPPVGIFAGPGAENIPTDRSGAQPPIGGIGRCLAPHPTRMNLQGLGVMGAAYGAGVPEILPDL